MSQQRSPGPHRGPGLLGRHWSNIANERATGLEPATSSLGSRTKLTGSLRKSLIFNGERPAWFCMRQRFGADSRLNGPQRSPTLGRRTVGRNSSFSGPSRTGGTSSPEGSETTSLAVDGGCRHFLSRLRRASTRMRPALYIHLRGCATEQKWDSIGRCGRPSSHDPVASPGPAQVARQAAFGLTLIRSPKARLVIPRSPLTTPPRTPNGSMGGFPA
jgi:hypothetical protein